MIELLNQEVIVTEANSIVYQILPRNHDYVTKGSTIYVKSTEPVINPSYVPIFMEESAAASVLTGMNALVTPAPYKQSQVGGIMATVSSIDKIPSNKDDLEARLGLYTISSQAVSKVSSPVLAILKLEKDPTDKRKNSGGYKWSSKSELPYQIHPTAPLEVKISTLSKSPISFILPSFAETTQD